jgi:predicted amidohydrolase YtcJ
MRMKGFCETRMHRPKTELMKKQMSLGCGPVTLVATLVSLALALAISARGAASEADVIFVHGRIYQPAGKDGSHLDCSKIPVEVSAGNGLPCESHSYSEALAVKDGKVLAVGDTKSILKLKGKHTSVIDLKGHFVLPGFNDAHAHLASGGFEKLNVDLVGTQSLAEMLERIAERVKTTESGGWIRGRGWDHLTWVSQKLPTREDLDAVTAGHPAIFSRVDGHISVANTAALEAAGITKLTPDPAGGRIDHDQHGDLTGILREGARDAVERVIPKVTPAERRKAVELALAEAARWGITSVQDNSSWQDLLVYEDLGREGKLTARISEWLSFDDPVEILEKERAHHAANDPMLRTGMLKGFMDGSLGSRTAALLSPYADDPTNSGLPQYDQITLNQMTRERLAAGFQIGFHAIGDRGVEMALAAFEDGIAYAEERKPDGSYIDCRLRVEHAQVTTGAQIERFKKLGVVASMQPNHLLTDMAWAMQRLGAERAASSYAWRSFLDAGVPLAFGTDYPVEPITPFRGLYAAATRKDESGSKEYFPQERLTIDEAIRAYTSGAAYAEFSEKTKGELIPGEWADLVVLDRDITEVPREQILATKVLRTVVGGRTVYEATE